MTTLSAVKTALATQIQAQTGLTCLPVMADQVNPPVGVILPGAPYAKYGVTLGAHLGSLAQPVTAIVEMNLVVAIFVSRAPSLERAQNTVDQYLVTVPAAMEFDPTLGGIVEYCEPQIVQAYGDVEIAGQTYFQGRIAVAVSVHQSYS